MTRFHGYAAAAIVVFALAAAAGVASANGGGRGGSVTLTPGVLDASGDGIVAAAGALTIRVCADDALLVAKGNVSPGDSTSKDQVDWLGLRVYFGFSGCADVSGGTSMQSVGGGGKAAALAAGTGLTLHAEGNGIAFLRGEGTWSDGNGKSGDWGADGLVVPIGGKQKSPCPVQAQHDDAQKPKCATGTPSAATPTATTAAPTPTATPITTD